MTDNNLKKIGDLVDQKINTALEPIKKDLIEIKSHLSVVKEDLNGVKKDLKGVKQGLDEVKQEVNGVKEELDKVKHDLTEIKDLQENQLLPAVVSIENTIKIYVDMYKINNDNTKKLEKRVETLEKKAGVVPPPEFTLSEL